jgi:hypothetical protein
MRVLKTLGTVAVLGISVALWCRSIGVAGEGGVSPHLSRPPDIPTERLERPRPEQDRPMLRQSEAVSLAKVAAQQSLGRSFDTYELKAAVFDPTAESWSVTFSPKEPRGSSEGCVVVFVRAETRATDVRRCS